MTRQKTAGGRSSCSLFKINLKICDFLARLACLVATTRENWMYLQNAYVVQRTALFISLENKFSYFVPYFSYKSTGEKLAKCPENSKIRSAFYPVSDHVVQANATVTSPKPIYREGLGESQTGKETPML